MADEGHDAGEAASELGVARHRVHYLAHRHNIRLGYAGGRRRMMTILSREEVDQLGKLAQAAAVSRSEMAARILSAACEDGGRSALRLLGILARPKRRWRRRRPVAA